MLLSSLLSRERICATFLTKYQLGERIYNNLKTIKIDLLEDTEIKDTQASTGARVMLKEILSKMYIHKDRLPKAVREEIRTAKELKKNTIKNGQYYHGYEALKALLYHEHDGVRGYKSYQSARKAGWRYRKLVEMEYVLKKHLAIDPTFKRFYLQKDAGKMFEYLLGSYAPLSSEDPIRAEKKKKHNKLKNARLIRLDGENTAQQEEQEQEKKQQEQQKEQQQEEQEQTFVEDDLSMTQGAVSELLSGSALNKTLHQKLTETAPPASRVTSILGGASVLIGSIGAYFAGKHLRDESKKESSQ